MKKLGFKIWLLLTLVFLSLFSIFVSSNGITFFQEGVVVTSVDKNSSVFEAGLRTGEIIKSIDGVDIISMNDFSNYINKNFPLEEGRKITIKTRSSEIIYFSDETPDVTVSEIPKTTLRAGLDLSGGARALIQAADKKLTQSEVNDLVSITRNRLNVYGLSEVKVSPVSDLSGNHFMLVEIAGATPEDLKEIIESQGKFEAKINNELVFAGGDKDIASVCRNDATCAGIESCQKDSSGNYFCNFRFTIYLSEAAARRHADITNKIDINSSNPQYLSYPLELYLDDQLVNSLLISQGLQGQVTTQISISGSGQGVTESEAYDFAEENMHKLQTVLITGSLPYQLEIVKLDTISPTLGKDFVKVILLAGLAALVAASIVVFIRYRNFKSALAIIGFSFSEIIIILGIASLIKWNLDLASIAGILATIGTGFDDQIVILDESQSKNLMSLKQRIKRAFAIIMGAYFTALVSLLPLLWAGAGLLKGFAITTIIGISVGVFITRPAFAEVVKRIDKDGS
jgi:preprotein translocase subunit SecD